MRTYHYIVLNSLRVALLATVLGAARPAQAALYVTTTNYSVGSGPVALWLGNLRGLNTYRDLAVANYNSDSVSVRLCLDDGTFGQENVYAAGPQPAAVRAGDYNRDGLEDLAVANSGTNTVSILLNLGVGANFRAATNFVVGSTANPAPVAMTTFDASGDGRLDLLVLNSNENNVSFLPGLGNGTFGAPTNYSVGSNPACIFATDMNRDGLTDLLTADSADGTVTILLGNTNAVFDYDQAVSLLGVFPEPLAVAASDLDGDNKADLVVADADTDEIHVIFGQITLGQWLPGAEFTYPVGARPSSLCVRDFNRDGKPDIAVANSGAGNVQIFLNDGNGGFLNQGTFAAGSGSVAIQGSNFNGDEATDLATANAGANTVSILLFGGPLVYNVTTNVNEDTPTRIVLKGFLLQGNSSLVFYTNSTPTNGTLSGPTSNLIYTPNTNFLGTDGFTFYAVDTNSMLTSAVARVFITVLPVNEAPSFDLSTGLVTVMEDALTTNISNFAINMDKGQTNESSQTLNFVVTSTNNAFFSIRPIISSTGRLTFRPAQNVTGTNTLTVVLRDSGGTARGGTNASGPETFSIVVLRNPLKPASGTYNGLFYETNEVRQISSGFFTFTVKATGLATGKIKGDGGANSFSGQFDTNGSASIEVVRNNNTTLDLDLQLDLTNGTDEVTGTVTETNWTAALLGDRATFHAMTNPAPQVGRYTMAFPGSTNSADAPGGDSYATISVASNGTVTATGRVGDTVSLSQSVGISKDGEWPFYVPLYSSRGSALGWITFTNLSGSLAGTVSWIKPAISGKFYPLGFTNLSDVIGSTYVAPANGVRAMGFTNSEFIVSGGNIPSPLTNAAVLTTNNTLTVNSATLLRLTRTSGNFSGSFIHPTPLLSRPLYGVVLQEQNEARGHFQGTNQGGAYLVLEND